MGWGSFAEKLNRALGGYKPEEAEGPAIPEQAVPEMRVEPTILPPKRPEERPLDNLDPFCGQKKWSPNSGISIYDAPAITRDSVAAKDPPLAAGKARRSKNQKQRVPEKEKAAALAS